MEGPYRDLGAGFARLSGPEGARRGPSRISHVEDALFELLRNARDAGARNIFVATTLRSRRYRALTVVDDGHGIPPGYEELVFEPGVTTRHLDPVRGDTGTPHDTPHGMPHGTPHGAGLSLYHLRNAALEARVASREAPTSVTALFDTRTLPERSLQSASRPSRSNILATCRAFAREHPALRLYCSSPARILASLLDNRIIQRTGGVGELERRAEGLGLGVSSRTVRRVLAGEVEPVGELTAEGVGDGGRGRRGRRRAERGGATLVVGERDAEEIEAILRRAAGASYLEIQDFVLESRPGEVSVRARVSEPEEEYD